MGVKAGNLPISTIDNTDYLLITEGEAPKRVSYTSVKTDIIGSETLTTTTQTVKGAINENKSNIDLKANNTDNSRTTTAKDVTGAINEVNASLLEIKKYPACKVYNSANISIPNAIYTALPLNNEYFDTDDMHDNAINNTRLTCKTSGVYLITGSVTFGVNSTGVRTGRITLNGTDFISTVSNNAASTVPHRLNINTIYKLNVNDYVELHVYQDSGNALDIINESKTSPVFGMVKVG